MLFTNAEFKFKKYFALVDANNFFASCERIFNPALVNKPVVILSSNDGCAIARSQEAKDLGIAMSAPLFTFQHLIKPHDIYIKSSNFELYGDISSRLMKILKRFTPDIEVYSVDEAFLELTHLHTNDFERLCKDIYKTVYEWIGIPITIGIAPTKTLAKVANRLSKQRQQRHMILSTPQHIENALMRIQVEDIWGVGKAMTKSLHQYGIFSGHQFAKMDPRIARKRYSVVGERIIRELHGFSCIELHNQNQAKQSLQITRSFGQPLFHFDDIAPAIATHITNLGEKLRRAQQMTPLLSVFCRTSQFQKENNYYGTATIGLDQPTNDTHTLLKYALTALKQCYKPGFVYKAAGIHAHHLIDCDSPKQLTLTTLAPNPISPIETSHKPTLNHAMDALNTKFGKKTIFFGACGLNEKHKPRFDQRSPRYTTQWDELINIS